MKLRFPNGEHADVPVRADIVKIGHGAGNDVVLSAEGVQAAHLQLTRDASGLAVVPEGTANVAVNGRPATGRTPVHAGDVIALGQVEMHLEADQDAGAAAGAPDDFPVDNRTMIRRTVVPFQLRGVSGAAFGRVFPLLARTVVGRDEGCDIALDVNEISRRHAAIESAGVAVRLVDLGSANGTFVNGERLLSNQPRDLHANDEIAFDKVRFLLERAGGPRKQASPPQPAPEPESTSAGRAGWIISALIVIIIIALIAGFLVR